VSHAQVPVFCSSQALLKLSPALKIDPSGKVSATKSASLHPEAVLTFNCPPDEGAIDVATGVIIPAVIVGADEAMVGDTFDESGRVGNASAGSSLNVTMGAGVSVAGTASAVCVNCAEIWATVVSTIAVFIVLISTVGADAAPILHDVNNKAQITRDT